MQQALYLIILLISMLLVIAVFSSEKRSKTYKTGLLLTGDILCAISLLLYPFPKGIGMAIPLLTVGILNLFAISKILAGENPNQETLNAWHDDPANWRMGVFYFNPKDKRIFPPKRIEGFGWTINFANPYSILALAGLIVLIIIVEIVALK